MALLFNFFVFPFSLGNEGIKQKENDPLFPFLSFFFSGKRKKKKKMGGNGGLIREFKCEKQKGKILWLCGVTVYLITNLNIKQERKTLSVCSL